MGDRLVWVSLRRGFPMHCRRRKITPPHWSKLSAHAWIRRTRCVNLSAISRFKMLSRHTWPMMTRLLRIAAPSKELTRPWTGWTSVHRISGVLSCLVDQLRWVVFINNKQQMQAWASIPDSCLSVSMPSMYSSFFSLLFYWLFSATISCRSAPAGMICTASL